MTAATSCPCPVCKGSGHTRTRTFDAANFRPGARPDAVTYEPCRTCDGTGRSTTGRRH